MKCDFLFPGQGAQYPGMGKDLYDANDRVKELFDRASKSAGFDLASLIFEGDEEQLKRTDITQIAITLINLSAATVVREHGVEPDRVAGFSLGEYSALVEAGVISIDDAFMIVRRRGEIMEAVSRKWDDAEGAAGMAAVIGLDFDIITQAIESSAVESVYPAIHNSPKQTVIAGQAAGLREIKHVLEQAGAKRYVPLRVSGPFHCPLMQEAKEEFEALLAEIPFHSPRCAVYSNVTARRVASGSEARTLCAEQLVSTVQWTDEQLALLQDGCQSALEVGPGSVLGGLWRALRREYRDSVTCSCYSAGTLQDIQSIANRKE